MKVRYKPRAATSRRPEASLPNSDTISQSLLYALSNLSNVTTTHGRTHTEEKTMRVLQICGRGTSIQKEGGWDVDYF